MFCQLRNLIYYLNACYAILYPKDMDIGIQTIDKTNEHLSVITVCRNTFHNAKCCHGVYMLQIPESTIQSTESTVLILVACAVLIEAISIL